MENSGYTKEQLEQIMEEIAPLQADFTDAIMRAADKIGVDRDGLYIHATNVLGIAARIGTYKDYEIPSAADVAPVKHAFNDNDKYHSVDEFRCSECGMHLEGWSAYFEDEDDGEYTAEYEFRYCPNCGARMDGDSNDC